MDSAAPSPGKEGRLHSPAAIERPTVVHPPGYWATAEYYASVVAFLQETDPVKYGQARHTTRKDAASKPAPQLAPARLIEAQLEAVALVANAGQDVPLSAPSAEKDKAGNSATPYIKPTTAQLEALAVAANAVQLAAISMAIASPDGLLAPDDDPSTYKPTHPKNVWALERRMRAQYREVELPLIGVRLSVRQRHWSDDAASGSCGFELHTTGGICWDGAVVLADFLTHHPAVIAAHSPLLARSGAWSWKGLHVVEIGCGAAPLPSFAAALCGAKAVLATDGSEFCLDVARQNATEFARAHTANRDGGSMAPVDVCELRWGEGAEAAMLSVHGFPARADVVLCADGLYVLGNAGAWSALIRTLRALTGTRGVVLLTYTERGAAKQFSVFLSRARAAGFHACEVAEHLLHASSRQGASSRLEQHVGNTRLFCLSPAVDAVSSS